MDTAKDAQAGCQVLHDRTPPRSSATSLPTRADSSTRKSSGSPMLRTRVIGVRDNLARGW